MRGRPFEGEAEVDRGSGAASEAARRAPPRAANVEVRGEDLPLHCPLPGMPLWSWHPKVYLPVEETGESKCPYCGTTYVLIPEVDGARS
jgi:uncharacterized Zn-finger protein